jgi:hypothetical protein
VQSGREPINAISRSLPRPLFMANFHICVENRRQLGSKDCKSSPEEFRDPCVPHRISGGAEWRNDHEHWLCCTPWALSHRHFHTCVENIAPCTLAFRVQARGAAPHTVQIGEHRMNTASNACTAEFPTGISTSVLKRKSKLPAPEHAARAAWFRIAEPNPDAHHQARRRSLDDGKHRMLFPGACLCPTTDVPHALRNEAPERSQRERR